MNKTALALAAIAGITAIAVVAIGIVRVKTGKPFLAVDNERKAA